LAKVFLKEFDDVTEGFFHEKSVTSQDNDASLKARFTLRD
jgi:hypothetical protein